MTDGPWSGTVVVNADEVVSVTREPVHVPGAPPLVAERTVRQAGAAPGRPPVILVHGLAQNRYSWRLSRRSLVACLAARGYEVFNLELRGHGLSREAGSRSADTFDDYVADVVRAIGVCRQPPFVVGHSLGAAAGIGAATVVPIAGLVSIAGVWTFATRNRFMRGIARISLRAERAVPFGRVAVRTRPMGHLIARRAGLSDWVCGWAPFSGWTPGSVEHDLLRERVRKGFDWTSAAMWLQLARWARGEPFAYAEAFAELQRPVVFVAGDRDALLHPDDARTGFEASKSPDKELWVFERAQHGGHWGHLDLILGTRAPEIVWPRLCDWLDAH